IILCTLTAFSFALNILLIAVISHKQCRLVGKYRYLLVSFAILDLTTSLLGLITHPVVIVSEYGLLSVSMNLLNCSGFIENLGTRVFNLTFYEPFLLLTFHFIYRYRALIAPENTVSKFRKGFALAVLIFLIYTCLAAIPAHLASMDPTKNRRFFVNASDYTSAYLRRRDAIPLAMLYFHDPVHRAHFDQTTLILLIVSGTVVSIPLCANVFLVYKIQSAVGNK
ncbi:hypothetical protein PRIPAC_77145, partial [Pristionchus pacificus]|uniref:G protein-coupled receptor n=1 Tax=Pristionchus pacificus TaxID=54126 RepID=A0A2A6CLN4_PRIPA